MAETPKKSVERPLKRPSCSDFCRVCGCKFNTYYGHLKRRLSTDYKPQTANFEIPKRAGVEKSRLAELLCELGITCGQSSSLSSRVCAKCSTKIRNAIGLFREVFSSSPRKVLWILNSPIAIKRFKRMARSPASEGVASSSNDGVRTGKARRSIVYGPSEEEKSPVLAKTDQLKVVIPTKNATISLRTASRSLQKNIVKNICNRSSPPLTTVHFYPCH